LLPALRRQLGLDCLGELEWCYGFRILGLGGILPLKVVVVCSGVERGVDSRRLTAIDHLPLPNGSLPWELGGAIHFLGRLPGPGWEGGSWLVGWAQLDLTGGIPAFTIYDFLSFPPARSGDCRGGRLDHPVSRRPCRQYIAGCWRQD
jgi:hypothetical protein